MESGRKKSTLRWTIGLITASIFSLVYFVAPFYMLTALLALLFKYPSTNMAWWYAAPIFISAIIPSFHIPGIWFLLRPTLDYFDYEEIHETSPIDVKKEILENGKNYLCVFQPHGVVSFVGIASAANAPPEFHGKFPTAVADAVLWTPILKHIMGIFGLISASKKSLQKQLRKRGVDGCCVLYVGGMAELFLSCDKEEKVGSFPLSFCQHECSFWQA